MIFILLFYVKIRNAVTHVCQLPRGTFHICQRDVNCPESEIFVNKGRSRTGRDMCTCIWTCVHTYNHFRMHLCVGYRLPRVYILLLWLSVQHNRKLWTPLLFENSEIYIYIYACNYLEIRIKYNKRCDRKARLQTLSI